MKKSFLSLAIALVLCLSLAVPAFAADPAPYEDEYIRVTNMVERESMGGSMDSGHIEELTCVAPVNIAPGTAYQDWHWEVGKFPEGMESVDEIEWFTPEGKSETLTEAGTYEIAVYSENGEYHLFIEVQAGQSTPIAPPDITDPGIITGFSDVKSGDWFYEPVQWAVKEGVTNGTSLTTFSPNQDCTVAHILTFLWRANGSPEAEGDNPFTDVKADDWFYGAALWAQEQGMVTGDTFNPNTPCTRSMAVKYLWQAAGSPSAKAASFTDVPAGADYAQAVNWAVEKGITNGTSLTTFSPSEVCTRGHIVTFLYRDLAK